MKPAILALFVLLPNAAAMAAQQPRYPVPPIPPAHPPASASVLPSRDLPGPREDKPPAITFDPNINRRGAPLTGQGFVPGSQYRLDAERNRLAAPGFQLRVPFP